MTTPINKSLRGIRDSMPGGYVLGRTGNGNGPPILLPISNFATKGYVANTSIIVGGAAGGDLSGTYPNPTVSKLLGRTLNTTPPSANQVMVWDGSDITWENQSGGIIIGSGAPSTLYTAGTIYSRSDEARDYSSQPVMSTAGIAQHKSFIEPSSTPGSVTLNSTPTPGNLIIAFISWGNSFTAQPTVNTSNWTQFITINATGVAGFALYRYVQPGDTAALPAFCSAGTDYWAAAVCEIGGVTGTFASDVVLSEGAYVQGASSQTSSAQMTTANGQLAILAGGSYGASLGPTFSAGWTTDESAGNNTNFGSNGLAHQTVATSGTSVTGTNTFGGFVSTTSTLFQIIVNSVSGLVAGWDELPLIDGTTITRNGSGVLSAPGNQYTQPTIQTFTTVVSGATYTTPAGCVRIEVDMQAPGGGSAGVATSGATSGGTASDCIFNSVHAAGGVGGSTSGAGGAGGAAGSGTATVRYPGAAGGFAIMLLWTSTNFIIVGGNGGNGPSAAGGGAGANGVAGVANSGQGAAGACLANATQATLSADNFSGGGGEGERVLLIIESPAATYTYTVADGGAAGTGTIFNGAKGGSGRIVVREYYV